MSLEYFGKTINDKLTLSLKDSSIKRYMFWLKDIMPIYNKDTLLNLYKTKTQEIINNSSSTSILATILKLLQIENIDNTNLSYIETEKLLNDIRNNNLTITKEPTDTDLKNQISVNDILLLRNKIEEKFIKKPNLRVGLQLQLLFLYTEIPPLRSQDYINTSFDKNESINYIDLEKKHLIIMEGKTTNKSNTRILDIPERVINIIKKVKELSNSIWLIPKVQNPNEKMPNDTFNKFMNTIFQNKKISASRLRNIFISYYNDKNMNVKDRKNIAQIMGHQLKTSQIIYTKFSKKIHDKDKYIAELEAKIYLLENSF